MDNKQLAGNNKNPWGAVILSALVPGSGFFYLGNFIKGITYLLILAALIILGTHSRDIEILFFMIICGGFYAFQIFESFTDATKINHIIESEQMKAKQSISLSAGVTVLFLGIVLLLATFDIISFRDILHLWPLVFILVGFKCLYTFMKNKETNEGGQMSK